MAEKILPKLLQSRKEAREKIEVRVEKGKQLYNRQINSEEELGKAHNEFKNWSIYNDTLLQRLFSEESLAINYRLTGSHGFVQNYPVNFSYKLKRHKTLIDSRINNLSGILEQLELYEEPSDASQDAGEQVVQTSDATFDDEVFIVHGRDDAAKLKVARFMEKLGIEATILHEQPNKGKTIIEKFEAHAQEAGFAIVLLTPDDVGGPQDNVNEAKPRARQNVILELGYFLARIGRERVCVLYKEEVELPSDMHGILYVSMDSADGWQLKLAKEMKQAGLPIDPEKLLLK